MFCLPPGGVVSSVEAVGGEGGIWAVSVTLRSRGTTVTIEIEADLDCELPGAVCAADGRRLFNRPELIVEAREYNPPMGAPTISGTAEVGETLTTDTSGISDADGLAGATFSYQWVSYDGSAETDIQGATDSTYPTFPIWLNMPLSKSSAFFKPLSICETLAVGMAIITP